MMRTLDEVRAYCDDCIAMWRDIRDDPTHEMTEMAPFYIDAFQSLRVSVFGELLPMQPGKRSVRDSDG